MNRRQVLMGGVAASAAVAGGGVAWWLQRRAASNAEQDAALAGLWAMRFEQPGGGELSLSASRGRPLLVNFWATWCPPCVKEMPLLDSFHRQHAPRGWQVVGLAVDSPTPVRSFLRQQAIGFPIGLAGMEGIELAKTLGNSGGQLPYTVVIDRAGRVHARMLGAVTEAQLAGWAADLG